MEALIPGFPDLAAEEWLIRVPPRLPSSPSLRLRQVFVAGGSGENNVPLLSAMISDVEKDTREPLFLTWPQAGRHWSY